MVDFYTPGPCQPWPARWTCSLAGKDPVITGAALDAASEMLYYLTGQRFSQCEVTIRPCREECYGGAWGLRGWAGWWGGYGGYTTPYNIGGQWYNITCGQCSSGCSCTVVSEIFLPGPVTSITEVKVDGVILTPDVDYRLDDYRKLVRLGALWPFCNDLNLADTQPGTWSVTAVYGEPVPVLGQIAVGNLACEFIRMLEGEDCALPPNVTEITRQGLSMSFGDISEDLTTFFSRYPMAYNFIRTYNPHNLMARARAYDIDGPEFRVVGTP